MTAQDITDLLNEAQPFIVIPKGDIDKDNEVVRRFINTYREVTGKTLGEGNCKNCILDAFFEWKHKTEKQLIFMTMERKYKLKETRVVGFNNGHYTNANITDVIAFSMVAFNRNHSASFVNGKELLSDYDKSQKVEEPKIEVKSERLTDDVNKPKVRKKQRGKAKG